MSVPANSQFIATLTGAPQGMVGDLTYSIERADNSVVLGPSTTNIVESAPGSYTATRTSPVGAGHYISVWYSAVYDVSTIEEFDVVVEGLIEAGLRYASPNDLRTHLGQPDLDDSLLIIPLRRAQRDIDFACGVWPIHPDTGLKFVTDMDPDVAGYRFVPAVGQMDRLREATCEQAEYRMTMGEDFMVKDQYTSEAGPDFSSVGKLRKVSPTVYAILAGAGLLRLGGRAYPEGRKWGDARYLNGLPNDV